MKQKLKRVALGLCMAACLFSLSACSKSDTQSSGVDANVQAQIEQLPASFLNLYISLPEDQFDSFREEMGVNEQFAGLVEGLDVWLNLQNDLGAFITIDPAVSVEKIDGGYSATVKAEFEKRPLEFTITTDTQISKISSVSFVPEYSTSEKLVKAGLNTLMGMGTVFLVLIFISFLISCFKYINKFEANKKDVVKTLPEAIPQPSYTPAPVQENLIDDLELVAVITAAIAASTGSTSNGLVVRSIKRAPAGNWKKA